MTKNQKIEAERFIVALLCDLLKEMAFSTRAKRKKNIDLYIDYSQAIGLTTIVTAKEHEKLDFDDYWKMFKDIASNMEEYIEMCSQYGEQAGMTNEQMKEYCTKLFPTLKRWKK